MQRDFHQTGGDCFPSIFFSIVVSDLLRHNLSDKNAILLNPPFFFAGPVDLKYFLPYYLTYIYIASLLSTKLPFWISWISQECLESLEIGWLIGDPRLHGGRCQGWSIARSFMGLATCNRKSTGLGLNTSSLGRTNEVGGIPRGEGFCINKKQKGWASSVILAMYVLMFFRRFSHHP